MDLEECYKRGLIKKIKISKELVRSLVEMSDIKEITVNSANINKVNISASFSYLH